MTAITIIRCCKKNFVRYGVPKIVHSDNARSFVNDEFRKFAVSWDFKMATSSPYYSQGNEKAESVTKIAKLLANELKQDIYKCLLIWRNTSNEIGSSPNQRLIGRRTRCDIPMTSMKLKPEIQGNVPENFERR
jgi:hypothetical protein